MTTPKTTSETTAVILPRETVHYAVTADAHPGALPRVLELFALRNITPDRIRVHKYQQNSCMDTNLSIDIHVSDLCLAEQEIILHKLAAQISVQNVRQENLYQITRAQLAS
ncbi:MAG: hypothetical protein JKY45_02680 [Emcibacter sp.]|nr:hypothetical protein [Emcibacter sp.]